MNGLFRMVRLHIRNIDDPVLPFFANQRPVVGRIFAKWISAWLPYISPLVRSLARVFGRNSNCIKVEGVFLRLCKPEKDLISAGKSISCVQAMIKVPDDPVSQLHAETLEDRVEMDVQRKHLPCIDIISDLPDDAAVFGTKPY